MSKEIIIGLGTGRCGTKSLAKIFSFQNNTEARHEGCRVLSWDMSSTDILGDYFKVMKNFKTRYFIDVAFWYLRYIDFLIDEFPNIKFVVLKRNKRNTVNSFYSKMVKRNTHLFLDCDNKKYNKTYTNRGFPNLDIEDRKLAIEKYYDLYYSIVDNKFKQYPRKFHFIKTEDLNNGGLINSMLRFVGYKNPIVKTDIRENVYNSLYRKVK